MSYLYIYIGTPINPQQYINKQQHTVKYYASCCKQYLGLNNEVGVAKKSDENNNNNQAEHFIVL